MEFTFEGDSSHKTIVAFRLYSDPERSLNNLQLDAMGMVKQFLYAEKI